MLREVSSRIKPVNSDKPKGKPENQRRHPVTGCRADTLMGLWLIDPKILEGYQNLVSTHDLVALKELSAEVPQVQTKVVGKVARIAINGPTSKYPTSFSAIAGGTSTLRVQKLITTAAADPEIGAILLDIDSPGGTTHGAFDFADVIAKAAKRKPIIAFGNGDMTSAAALSSSQASYVIATPETQVGSIGVKAVLKDTSEAYAKMGVKVIPVTSGKLKALAESGTVISKSEIQRVQSMVDDINAMLVAYVAKGRGLDPEKIQNLEGDFFRADKGKLHGLIDEVGDEDRALAIAAEAAANPEKFISRKAGTPAGATTSAAPNTEADSSVRSNRVMLTPEQLAQAKQLPGAKPTLTAENADVELLGIASDLAGKLPKTIADADAKRYIALAGREVDLLVKEERLVPEQATKLKELIKPSMVASDGSISLSMDALTDVLKLNRPAGLVQETTEGQPQGKTEPGKPEAEKPLTKEEVDAHVAASRV